MRIRVTDTEGEVHELEGLEGWRVMEVIRDWGVPIKAECGGSCTCATCHVYVARPWYDRLPPPTAEEEDLLFASVGRRSNSRLSCQILLSEEMDGLELQIAPSATVADAA